MAAMTALHTARWKGFLQDCADLVSVTNPLQISGHLTRVAGLVIEAVGLQLPVGSDCTILLPTERPWMPKLSAFQEANSS